MPFSPELTYETGSHRLLPVEPPLFDAYFSRMEHSISHNTAPSWEKRYDKAGIGVVISGCFDYRAQTGAATAVPGTVVFGNPGEMFNVRYLDSENRSRLVVWYDNGFLESIAAACDLDEPRFRTAALPPGKMATAMFAAMQALARGSGDAEDAACGLASKGLAIGSDPRKPIAVSERDRQRIRAAVGYIEHAFGEPCTVEALAKIGGLSRYHFMRLFKAVTGQSANQYVINTRLRAAATRIAETKAPLSEIAYDVGFNDISHFNTRFRAAFDCTPREMRKRARAA